ncbi:MAG: uracil-DNA glycosylase family protein [Alphaproteobacteria bacterium]|nr:uracil-DNA glycosylase family protein [Alphaproteobacteria bacterium]
MSGNGSKVTRLRQEIAACQACSADLPHGPRPVLQFGGTARIVIIGQAPGARVHTSGVPWDDPSGARLRAWTEIPQAVFYDSSKIALVPMGFCYPGKGKSGDLPPRPACAPLWHARVFDVLPQDRLTLLVGCHAQARYLPARPKRTMTENVRIQPGRASGILALPHPSWRSTNWVARNPWFAAQVLPELRKIIRHWLGADPGQAPRPWRVL